MNLRQYLVVMAIGTAAALSAWCIVLIAMNPLTSGAVVLVAFFLMLSLGLAGLFSILGMLVRTYRFPKRDIGGIVKRSLRQSIFLTVLLVGSLYLMTQGMFSTLTLFIAVLALGFLEFFFLVSSKDELEVEDAAE
ncbi:MAG: hypothetical protein WAZ14_03555 [Patescibacteria group bacterium]